MPAEPLFEEIQYLAWPFSAIGLGGSALGGFGVARSLGLLGQLGVAAAWAAGAVALARAFLLPMRVTVDRERVRVQFGEWTRFTIALAEIARAYPRRYNPILEYGGWGIRLGWGEVAYNMRGNEGVQLHLRSGRRVLIGSQRSGELAAAIHRLCDCAGAPEEG